MSFVQHSIGDCLLCALHDFTKVHLLSPHTKLCTIACYTGKIMYKYIQRDFCLQSYSKFKPTTSHKRAMNFTSSIIFGTEVCNCQTLWQNHKAPHKVSQTIFNLYDIILTPTQSLLGRGYLASSLVRTIQCIGGCRVILTSIQWVFMLYSKWHLSTTTTNMIILTYSCYLSIDLTIIMLPLCFPFFSFFPFFQCTNLADSTIIILFVEMLTFAHKKNSKIFFHECK